MIKNIIDWTLWILPWAIGTALVLLVIWLRWNRGASQQTPVPTPPPLPGPAPLPPTPVVRHRRAAVPVQEKRLPISIQLPAFASWLITIGFWLIVWFAITYYATSQIGSGWFATVGVTVAAVCIYALWHSPQFTIGDTAVGSFQIAGSMLPNIPLLGTFEITFGEGNGILPPYCSIVEKEKLHEFKVTVKASTREANIEVPISVVVYFRLVSPYRFIGTKPVLITDRVVSTSFAPINAVTILLTQAEITGTPKGETMFERLNAAFQAAFANRAEAGYFASIGLEFDQVTLAEKKAAEEIDQAREYAAVFASIKKSCLDKDGRPTLTDAQIHEATLTMVTDGTANVNFGFQGGKGGKGGAKPLVPVSTGKKRGHGDDEDEDDDEDDDEDE